MKTKNVVKLVGAGLGGILGLTILMGAFEQVDTGHRGIFVTYGKPTSQVAEGLQFMNPLTTEMVQMDVRQLKWQSSTVAYTKDVQQAEIEFALTYHLNPDSALKVYQEVGTDWARVLVSQVVVESIKQVFGSSEAVKDTINNRAMVGAKIKEQITANLAERNVIVDGFELRDVSFSEAFENAVEEKQVAVEKAQTAKNNTVRIEEEARQKVISAEAEAEAMRIQTAALAGNSKLVEWEAVKAWDGKLPVYMLGESTPFLNIK